MSLNTGNAILSNAITVDSSYNVGIGTSSPGSLLDVNGTLRATGAATFSSTIQSGVAGSGFSRMNKGSSTQSGYFEIFKGDGSTRLGFMGYNNTNFAFEAENAANFTFNGGNVGIGTSSPERALDIRGGSSIASHRLQLYNNYSNVYMQLYTGGDGETGIISNSFMTFFSGSNATERMRITSGGELLVGTSSSVWASGGRGVIEVRGSSTALVGLKFGSSTGGYMYHNGVDMYINNDQSTRLYCISSSGGVYLSSGATSWTANSDERLKTITGNIENAVDSLLTLRTIKHTWKSDKNNKEHLALIAQDVEKIFPQIIDKGKLPSNPNQEQIDETEYLGVRYTELIPVLVKAIQELEARIKTLENK